MRPLRYFPWLLPVLLVFLLPASSHAGVFISVGYAPPPLVTYVQPICPEPGLIWMPGYWAYGDDGYYWVPGAWVPAPYMGAYWTPGYWGWGSGLYMWHPGYWGPAVGYYGGINYGYGYYGTGFVGGMWRGRMFAYNTAVMRVNTTVIRNVYVDRTVIREHTIVDNHVAYNGGPGGIRHDPTPREREAMNQPRMAPTRYQQQHMEQAMHNRSSYFRNNHGRPSDLVARRPLPAERHAPPAMDNRPMNSARPNETPNRGRNAYEPNRGGQNRGGQNPGYQGGRGQTMRPNPPRNENNGMRPAPEQQRPQPRPNEQQYQQRQQQQQQYQQRQQYQREQQYQQQQRQYQQRQQPQQQYQQRQQQQREQQYQQQQRQYQQQRQQYQRPPERPQGQPQAGPQGHQPPRNNWNDRRR